MIRLGLRKTELFRYPWPNNHQFLMEEIHVLKPEVPSKGPSSSGIFPWIWHCLEARTTSWTGLTFTDAPTGIPFCTYSVVITICLVKSHCIDSLEGLANMFSLKASLALPLLWVDTLDQSLIIIPFFFFFGHLENVLSCKTRHKRPWKI